jgi:putative DNA primase/helicase
VNLFGDLSSKDLVGSSALKSLTGGDTILGERKFKTSFDFKPYVRLIFSTNEPPRTPDADAAYYSRWIVVPFDRSFRGTDQEIPAHELDARLADPRELSGLLNRALSCLSAVRDRGIDEPRSLVVARQAFRAATDPLGAWVETNTVVDPSGVTLKKDLLSSFNRQASLAGEPPATSNGLSRAVRRSRPTVSSVQRRLNGGVADVWIGLRLADESLNVTRPETPADE